jgi:hypothetical protein
MLWRPDGPEPEPGEAPPWYEPEPEPDTFATFVGAALHSAHALEARRP